MRRVAFSATILIIASVCTMGQGLGRAIGINGAGEIKNKYDRFDDTTTVSLSFLQLNENSEQTLYLGLVNVYKGASPRQLPEKIAFSLMSASTVDYQLAARSSLRAIADGERVDLGNPTLINTQRIDALFVQVTSVVVDYPSFKKIVNAKHVEMRLDNTEFSLSDTQLAKLRQFEAAIRP